MAEASLLRLPKHHQLATRLCRQYYLTAAEVALLQHSEREFVMRELLRADTADFDYVLIDCPPSLNILTVNALVAATSVLIPMQCEYYALEGLSALLDTVDGICEKANPSLQIEGLLRTMYDPRNGLTEMCRDN